MTPVQNSYIQCVKVKCVFIYIFDLLLLKRLEELLLDWRPQGYDVKDPSDLNSDDLQLVAIHLEAIARSQLQPILVPCDLRLWNTMSFT